METKKKWTRAEIDELINDNDRAVERGIVQLFNLQTADERRAECTKLHNGVGFNSCSARLGTYYAKWVLSGRRLTGTHLHKARKIVLKHSRQLVDIANAQLVQQAA